MEINILSSFVSYANIMIPYVFSMNYPTTGSKSVSVLGLNFASFDGTFALKFESTLCENILWKSDSSI